MLIRTTDKSGISTFIDAAFQLGMKHVVCSPGSRNAPLVIAIDQHPDIETIVIHDERSAGFYALGMALQLNAPVGIVCTSGSAMLNYYPAVAEAYYQCIPIVVMTADRPEEWVNHGDGQTIVQTGVYANHIRYEGRVDEFITSESRDQLLSDITQAFELGNGHWKGPVHFNFPVTEPLYNQVEVAINPMEGSDLKIVEEGQNFLLAEEFKTAWVKCSKKMILCGQMNANTKLIGLLAELAEDSSIAVLVENTSNLQDQRFVHCIDRTLSAIHEDEIENFQPDLLITIGGAIISKRIKNFLREANIKEHCKVGFEFPEMDTYRSLTRSVECNPSIFMDQLLNFNTEKSNTRFGLNWKQKDYEFESLIEPYIQTAEYSDLTVFDVVLDYIPENSNLYMGNSSVVRYCQLFNPVKSLRYFSNRGTSGIDGCTSTACGGALVTSDKLSVLITGDVSFFYDSNALWSNHLPSNLRIIVINNGGGGIFKIIDGPASTGQLEKYFEAKHSYSAEYICKAFDVTYLTAHSLDSIEEKMNLFYEMSENQRPKLIEIFTPSEKNDKVLREFFKLASLSK